jgi:hypothetical protein
MNVRRPPIPAGVVEIAAPQIVDEMGRRFDGNAWRTWLDALLWRPVLRRSASRNATAWLELHAAMNFMAPHNPVVRARRLRTTD